MNTEAIEDYIDRYISDEMSADEEEIFEDRLIEDSEFERLYDKRMSLHEFLQDAAFEMDHDVTILAVYVDGKIVKQVLLSDKIEVPLSETGNVVIKDGDMVVFDKVIKFPKKIEKKAPLNFREERKAAFKTYRKTEETFEYLGKNISVIFDIDDEQV